MSAVGRPEIYTWDWPYATHTIELEIAAHQMPVRQPKPGDLITIVCMKGHPHRTRVIRTGVCRLLGGERMNTVETAAGSCWSDAISAWTQHQDNVTGAQSGFNLQVELLMVRLDDYSLTWLYGHHPDDSPELAAMIALRGLAG